jgi:hypothetical protein
MTIENEDGGECIDREKVEGEGEEGHGNELQDGDAHNTEQYSEEVAMSDSIGGDGDGDGDNIEDMQLDVAIEGECLAVLDNVNEVVFLFIINSYYYCYYYFY